MPRRGRRRKGAGAWPIVCAIIRGRVGEEVLTLTGRAGKAGGRVGDRVTYVGHATVLIELEGKRLLTDPVLRRRIGPLRRQGGDPPAGVTDGIDAVLLSHLHLDHSDRRSLRRLDPQVPVLGPRGSGEFLRARRVRLGDRAGAGRGCDRRRSARRGHACRAWRASPPSVEGRSPGDRLSGRRRPARLLRRRHRPVRRDERASPRAWTWRCCRSGGGARRLEPATWTPSAPRGRSPCWSRGSQCRSTGARSSRWDWRAGGPSSCAIRRSASLGWSPSSRRRSRCGSSARESRPHCRRRRGLGDLC